MAVGKRFPQLSKGNHSKANLQFRFEKPKQFPKVIFPFNFAIDEDGGF